MAAPADVAILLAVASDVADAVTVEALDNGAVLDVVVMAAAIGTARDLKTKLS